MKMIAIILLTIGFIMMLFSIFIAGAILLIIYGSILLALSWNPQRVEK